MIVGDFFFAGGGGLAGFLLCYFFFGWNLFCFEQHYFYHDVIWQMIVNNGY